MSSGVDKQVPRSLLYGLQLLRSFTAERPVRSISELAQLMGVSPPTAHRYATTCLELGYIEQAPLRRYRLAASSAQLGCTMLATLPLVRCADPILRNLRQDTGRTVSLAVLDGNEVVYLRRLRGIERGQYELERGLGAGSRRPAESTAAGRALLAAKRERQPPPRAGRQGSATPEADEREPEIEIHHAERAGASSLASAIRGAHAETAALEITLPGDTLGDQQSSLALTHALSAAAAQLGHALDTINPDAPARRQR